MSAVILNEVRKGFYLDSVALMRLSRSIAAMDGVEEAAVMMGTPANREIMRDAGVLDSGTDAGGGDLVIAIRATSEATARGALTVAAAELDAPRTSAGEAAEYQPKTIRSAVETMPDATLALISVPGDFAISEARKAIRRGLHAMIFSDNVDLGDEAELKREAQSLGKLVMGPDCGTAIIDGTPLAFANVVRRGGVGIVGASGTGIQEVTCLIDSLGGGISHAVGVGGRDLKAEVGGISTLMAIDALAADSGTERIVLIAKPPADAVARRVIDRLAASGKPGVVCFMGAEAMEMPDGIAQVFTLRDAAFTALDANSETAPTPDVAPRNGSVLGLYSGGTLAAEAQVIFRDAGHAVASNAPVPGTSTIEEANGHQMLDLGEDEYTRGRPHPMIDPAVRDDSLAEALGRKDLSTVLVDVVLGFGAHTDPAGHLADMVKACRKPHGPHLIASVTGTEADPQGRSRQVARLEEAGILVAPSNEDAARWALALSMSG